MSKETGGAQVDIIHANGSGTAASGSVAMKLLQNGMNVNALRTQDVLRKNEWIKFDEKVVEVARKRLVAVGDLMDNGLTYEVPNALGITKVEWERIGDLGDATVSMNGLTQGQSERLEYELLSVPLPIIHKDFQINIRALEASRNMGTPLDTAQAALAARIVAEKVESMLFLGTVLAGTNNQIFGYTTQTNRNTGSVSASWASAATGDQMLADTLGMIEKLVADNMYGPYMMYTSLPAFVRMGSDFKASSDKSILQRLKEVPGILDIKPSPDLTGTNVVVVQMTSDVVDIIDGLQPTLLQWDSHGGMLLNFKVMAIMAPRVKADKATQSGIVHYS